VTVLRLRGPTELCGNSPRTLYLFPCRRTNRTRPDLREVEPAGEIAQQPLSFAGIKIVDLIAVMPSEGRAEALEAAESRFLRSGEEFGCAEPESRHWTAAVMRILRERVEELVSKQKLKALYEELIV